MYELILFVQTKSPSNCIEKNYKHVKESHYNTRISNNGGEFMHKFKIQNLLTLLVLIVVLLISGCFFNPSTGRYGPSWEVPLRIPLIANEITIPELLDDLIDLSYSSDILQAELSVEETLDLNDIEFEFKSIEINFEEEKFDLDEGINVPYEYTTKFNLNQISDIGEFESISFKSGSIRIEFTGENIPRIEQITINNKPYNDQNDIELKDLVLTNNTEFTISGELDPSNYDIEKIFIDFSDITINDIDKITGRDFKLEIPEMTFQIDFELPSELEKINFRDAQLNLELDYYSKPNDPPKMDFGDITISPLKIVGDTSFTGSGNLQFDKNEVLEILNNGIDEIAISGQLNIGKDSLATFSFEDSLTMNLQMSIPLEFEITEDIIYESEVFPIEIDKDTIEELNKLTNRIHGEIAIKNHLPLGSELTIYVSNDEEPILDEQAVKINFGINEAPTNDTGIATSTLTEQILVEIPNEIRTILTEKSYAQIHLSLSVPSNGLVTFTQHDFINIQAWIELMANVNK